MFHSQHIREKDGLWAVLAWLSVLANYNNDVSKPLVSVQEIVEKHWATFGRHFYSRYDYEAVAAEKADEVMETLAAHFPRLLEEAGLQFGSLQCKDLESFTYEDPLDGSFSENQGIILTFDTGERAIFRLSGTGSEGATIRVYLEKYEADASKHSQSTAAALREVAAAALEASDLCSTIGRENPTVIT